MSVLTSGLFGLRVIHKYLPLKVAPKSLIPAHSQANAAGIEINHFSVLEKKSVF